MSLLPLRGDLRDQVETALGHRYRGLRLRYWQQGNVTTWIIDEKSKDMPMTLAVAVGPAGISHLNVLVYREPRGGEVHQAFFRQQFVGMTLQDDLSLSREVDGITGATLKGLLCRPWARQRARGWQSSMCMRSGAWAGRALAV